MAQPCLGHPLGSPALDRPSGMQVCPVVDGHHGPRSGGPSRYLACGAPVMGMSPPRRGRQVHGGE
eukprot:6026594-Prorocentrum_lima.AAC.1